MLKYSNSNMKKLASSSDLQYITNRKYFLLINNEKVDAIIIGVIYLVMVCSYGIGLY